MTLGSELASEPPAGAGIIAEKDGYIWAFLRTGSTKIPVKDAHWVAATIKNEKYYTWTVLKTNYRILVVFEANPTPRVRRVT